MPTNLATALRPLLFAIGRMCLTAAATAERGRNFDNIEAIIHANLTTGEWDETYVLHGTLTENQRARMSGAVRRHIEQHPEQVEGAYLVDDGKDDVLIGGHLVNGVQVNDHTSEELLPPTQWNEHLVALPALVDEDDKTGGWGSYYGVGPIYDEDDDDE